MVKMINQTVCGRRSTSKYEIFHPNVLFKTKWQFYMDRRMCLHLHSNNGIWNEVFCSCFVWFVFFFFNKLRTIHRSCKYETMEQNKQWAGLYSFESENEKCSCKGELLNRNCMIFVFQSTQAGVCMIKWKGLFAVEILLNSKLNAGRWKVISVKYFGITCLHNCTVREYIANYDSVDNSLSCFISVWF